ncbi:MAG: hypothetical protein KBB55_01805 [Candidatus Buchananbacteria bacterium]|nr:hypothetical protein [Candidatus Buchananbacteria bacterium]
MKISRVLHVISVMIGFLGVGVLFVAAVAGQAGSVFGFSREHLLFCSIIVFLIAIWLQVATIHHVMIEKDGKVI